MAPLPRTLTVVGLIAALAGCGGSDPDSNSEPAGCDPEDLVWVYDRVTSPEDHGYPSKIFRFHEGDEEALTDDDAASGPSLSPDGRRIVFERGSAGDPESAGYSQYHMYVMNSDGSDETPLLEAAYENPQPRGGYAWDTHPVWSPDGSHVAFVRNVEDDALGEVHNVMVVSPDGGEPRPVPGSTADLHDPAPAWSSDSTRLAWLNRAESLHWSSLDGAAAGSVQLAGAFGPPAWIDGDTAIVVAFHPNDDPEDAEVGLYRVDTTSGDVTQLDVPVTALGTLPTGELVGLEGSQESSRIVVVDLHEPQDRQEITTVQGSRILPEGSVGADARGPITAVPDAPDGWSSCP